MTQSAKDAELEALRAQVASMNERLQSLENHGAKLVTDAPSERPNGAYSARIEGLYLRERDRLSKLLRQELLIRWDQLAFGDNLQRGITDDRGKTIRLEDLPRVIAARLTRETDVKEELAGSREAHDQKWGDNRNKIIRLEVELAQRERNTADLLACTTLPELPRVLLTAMEAAGGTAERGLINAASIGSPHERGQPVIPMAGGYSPDLPAGSKITALNKPTSGVGPIVHKPKPEAPWKPESGAAPVTPPRTPRRSGGAAAQPEKPAEHRVVVGKRGDPNEYVRDGAGKTRQLVGPRPGEER